MISSLWSSLWAVIRAVGRWCWYAVWLLGQVARSSYSMAFDVQHRRSRISPAILRLPLRHMTSAEVSVLATSITLTPGSLVLAIDRGDCTPDAPLDSLSSPGDTGYLIVHVVYAEDVEHERESLHHMRRTVMKASRGWGWTEES